MRYHRAFRELAIPIGAQPLRDVAAAQTLVAARFEPAVRAGKGCAILDLHFRCEERRAVVPMLIVDPAMLEARERDPLVWPEFVRGAGLDDFGIARRVEGWIAELFARGEMSREHVKVFGDDADAEFLAAARGAGFLGAAPLEEVVRRAAPFVFARRHARGRDVVIASRNAALGAALLTGIARRIKVASDDSRAIAWYAPPLADAEPEVVITDEHHRDAHADDLARARVVIDLDDGGEGLHVEPSPSVPLDVLFDFTAEVRRGEPRFSVAVRAARTLAEALVPQSAPVGGSSGRILFALRRGARRFGGADADCAESIAAAMRDEGFTVAVVDDPQEAVAFAPDLVHAFGVADAAATLAYRRAAAALGVPFALHPLFDCAALGGYWGAAVTPYAYRFMHDEASVLQLLALLRARRLGLNDIVADTPFHPTNPRWERDAREAIASADAVYVAGAGELEAVRGFASRLDGEVVSVSPPVAPAVAPAPIDALVGGEPFVLLHAPIESTQNQIQAVRAAQLAQLPLVVAGPVTDADYAALVRAFAGDRTIVLGEPDAATLEGLYRGAEVFIDVAWVGCGLTRCARAVSRGAALAVSARMPAADLGLGDFACAVDPGDAESIARGLGDVWYRRHEEPRRFAEARRAFVASAGVREVTQTIVAGYAKALERRNPVAAR
jgi:hypothetical protein